MSKLTVKELMALKGVRTISNVNVTTTAEARACEAAGIDIINSGFPAAKVHRIAESAPNTFFVNAIHYGQVTSIQAALYEGFAYLRGGADAIYCSMSVDYVEALTKEGIPCVGHVGMIPYKSSWTGGYKAVGKTVEEAVAVYEHALRFQDAGAIGIEVELVPDLIAAEISGRLSILTFGMGAGSGCDSQYLFATDILGTNTGHVPRHAKVYRNHAAEYARLYDDSVEAFKEFKMDLATGAFPAKNHNILAPSDLLDAFRSKLGG
jgi:3-methyl-2-oxobutanoate hydroxymethyltransferase